MRLVLPITLLEKEQLEAGIPAKTVLKGKVFRLPNAVPVTAAETPFLALAKSKQIKGNWMTERKGEEVEEPVEVVDASGYRTCVLMNTSMIDENWCFQALRPFIDPADQVCVLAFSFFDDTRSPEDWNRQYKKGQGIWYRSNTDVFFRYGLKENQIRWVNYFTDSIEQMKDAVRNSSILLLTGGAPDWMMKRIREKKLKSLLKNYRGLVIGYSAGAMVQLDSYHITPDEDYPQYSVQKGLGYLHDFDIEVHYRQSKGQIESIHKTIASFHLPVYAIYEDGGLICKGDGSVSCFGKVDLFEPEQ